MSSKDVALSQIKSALSSNSMLEICIENGIYDNIIYVSANNVSLCVEGGIREKVFINVNNQSFTLEKINSIKVV